MVVRPAFRCLSRLTNAQVAGRGWEEMEAHHFDGSNGLTRYTQCEPRAGALRNLHKCYKYTSSVSDLLTVQESRESGFS